MKKTWMFIVTTSLTVGVVLAVVSLIRAGPVARPDLQAGAPTVVSYQGKVAVDGDPYEGTGYFKFAVVDAGGTPTYWSNDGTSGAGGEPAGAVPLPVSRGLFDVLLGDTDLSGMSAPLTSAAFDGTERYLRVWFSETGAADTFTQLSPDRRIAAAPYALQAQAAEHAADADTLDGQHAAAFADAVHTHLGSDITSAVPTATLALSATHAGSAMEADTVDGRHAGDFVPRLGEAYVVVAVTGDPAANGDNLLSAYAEAAALTPHGQPLSTTNRAVVLLPPGRYDLGSDPLALDAEYVDVEGLSNERERQHIYGTAAVSSTGVISQSADDVRLANLFVEIRRESGGVNLDASDPAAYFPEGDERATVIRNCRFRAADEGHAWSMRIGTAYPGTYEQVRGYTYAFGGRGGSASGTFIDCTGGDRAFGGRGGSAGGTFVDCTGGDQAFGGWNGAASGTFTRCTGGAYAFGGAGTASGTFTHCTGGDEAFGGSHGTAPGGVFRYCIGGAGSFTASGSPAPLYFYCIRNGAAYP